MLIYLFWLFCLFDFFWNKTTTHKKVLLYLKHISIIKTKTFASAQDSNCDSLVGVRMNKENDKNFISFGFFCFCVSNRSWQKLHWCCSNPNLCKVAFWWPCRLCFSNSTSLQPGKFYPEFEKSLKTLFVN